MIGTWKLIPTLMILGATAVALMARPPQRPVQKLELARLVASVAVLYGVGAVAVLAHRMVLAGIVFGMGLLICALALWLSRGDVPPAPPDDDGGPPVHPEPDPPRDFDWAFYEDQFREPAAR